MTRMDVGTLDHRYDVFIEYDDTKRELVVMDGEKELLREATYWDYEPRFGPDVLDMARWQERAAEVVDKT